MRVTVGASSNDLIDDKYKNSSREVLDYLANLGCDLNWGSGSSSIMGISYQEFLKHNRNMYGYTTSKYMSDIDNLPNAKHNVYETTFDLKKNIFKDADLLLMLPGGTGTISEFFAYLEEIRSNDVDVPLVVYNVDGHYDSSMALIDDLVKRKFNSENIYDYIKVINSFDEFKEYYNSLICTN